MIAIIAGSGQLPINIAKKLQQTSKEFLIVSIANSDNIDELKTLTNNIFIVSLTKGGTAIKYLKAHNVKELVLAGSVKRPSILNLKPDAWTVKNLKKIKSNIGGDDGLLRGVIKALEDEGFTIISPQDINQDIIVKAKIYNDVPLDEQMKLDIEKGYQIIKTIGSLDIGQAVIVQQGTTVAVEALEGTDNMLLRSKELMLEGKKAVLVKATKPNQDTRVDLPTIGMKTIINAHESGIRAIALEAGSAIILDENKLITKCNELGISLLGFSAEALNNDPTYQVKKKVYIIAGEASGDMLAAQLMAQLKNKYADEVVFFGIGGQKMKEQGLKSIFPMGDLSHMGLISVIANIKTLKKRLQQTEEHISYINPDVIITVDSPGFNKRVIKNLIKENQLIAPTIHWVAPSVWAWREGRAKKMAKLFDHLLCLLPFEPKYFEKEGLKTTVTGHPILDSGADKGNAEYFRQKYHIFDNEKLLVMLPGSRHNEVKKLLPVFKDVYDGIIAKNKRVKFVIPLAEAVAHKVKQHIKDWHLSDNILLLENSEDKYHCFAAADLAIAASGTVSLELAMAKTPTIIAYKFGFITNHIIPKIMKIKYASLINILANKMVIPEYILYQCKAEDITSKAIEFLNNPSLFDNKTCQLMLENLKANDSQPATIASNVVSEYLNDKNSL